MNDTRSVWNPKKQVLHSALKGVVSVDDVNEWKASLREVVSTIPAGQSFKLLFDLHGYEPATIDAHKAMRAVIPLLLAKTGMRPAVIDLFDENLHVDVTDAPRIRCAAFANLHHDPDKMASYEAKIAKPNQRFFSDPDLAEHWLDAQPL